ncbi:MAG: hypothetical protein FJ279_30210, partial [Planctomycetes bacterium]|nr:hypothetical protein [Planctomycetota bacterium]
MRKADAAAGVALGLLMTANGMAAEVFVPREGAVPMSSPYVPVRLDDYANDSQGVSFPSRRVTVQGIPFDLVGAEGADNLFLRSAEWPDWKEDPSSYYAAYDSAPKAKDSRRPFFQIPVADYECVYLLAAADNDANLSPVVTFRIGVFGGPARAKFYDFQAAVPRVAATKGENVVRVIPIKAGRLFLMRIPLGVAFAQDFKDRLALDVEVTKE